jgi:signal transduction histidine kinase
MVQKQATGRVERLNPELEPGGTQRSRDLDRASHKSATAGESRELLSRTTHDLKNQLNSILGFAQLLETSTLSPYDRECVDQILLGGRRLLELIEEMLDADTPS